MLCTLFESYLENRPMRLHDIERSARRARKAFAHGVAALNSAETPKARKRAERHARAGRRAMLESQRAADVWTDWADA
jgi:hypothetical protein